MRARKSAFLGVLTAALLIGIASDAAAWVRRRDGFHRATGPTQLGPWVRGVWDQSADPWAYGYDYNAASPWNSAWYPWGYTTPFVRVGRQCVAADWNMGTGGYVVRYQRVRPAYYCSGG
jgi:hypothetical protein